MAHYDDVIFPIDLKIGSQTSPKAGVDVVYFDSGFRAVNRRWSQFLRTFTAELANETEDFYTFTRLFMALGGNQHSGLLRDWSDWNSSEGFMDRDAFELGMVTPNDQPLLNSTTDQPGGDGSTVLFQLVKQYEIASAVHYDTIEKPDYNSIQVAVDGIVQTLGANYTLNAATGEVTFSVAPGSSQNPTWGGAFYRPAHFMDDEFPISLEAYHRQARGILLRQQRISTTLISV